MFSSKLGLKSSDSVPKSSPVQAAGATIEVAKLARKFHQFPRGKHRGGTNFMAREVDSDHGF